MHLTKNELPDASSYLDGLQSIITLKNYSRITLLENGRTIPNILQFVPERFLYNNRDKFRTISNIYNIALFREIVSGFSS